MVSPDHFGFNEETAVSNSFQKRTEITDIVSKASREFDEAVRKLRSVGIDITVCASPIGKKCPDAVFPNNWISTHHDGRVILFPMCTPNRRSERDLNVIDALKEKFEVKEIIRLDHYENEGRFLEGTGSIVFDHGSKTAYACLSPRTDEGILDELCRVIGYRSFVFDAVDLKGSPIYHTNVMMAIGNLHAIVCLDSIPDVMQRQMLLSSLGKAKKNVIQISYAQMNDFAGNMLEVEINSGKSFWVMSETAFNSLTAEQKKELTPNELLPLRIPTIETIGGGSARCMMAEIHLSAKIP